MICWTGAPIHWSPQMFRTDDEQTWQLGWSGRPQSTQPSGIWAATEAASRRTKMSRFIVEENKSYSDRSVISSPGWDSGCLFLLVTLYVKYKSEIKITQFWRMNSKDFKCWLGSQLLKTSIKSYSSKESVFFNLLYTTLHQHSPKANKFDFSDLEHTQFLV